MPAAVTLPQPTSPRLAPRRAASLSLLIRVAARRGALDRALAAGRRPDTPMLAVRSRQLSSARCREQLACAIERAIARGWEAPPRRLGAGPRGAWHARPRRAMTDDPPQRPPAPATELAEHYARGELAYQLTAEGVPVFPPRLAAAGTGGALAWRVSAGAGEVYATTVVRPRGEEPYNVALVQLDEGFRMMSRVRGVAPEEVQIGDRVRARFDGETPVFERA
jgi:uncharacterized protein